RLPELRGKQDHVTGPPAGRGWQGLQNWAADVACLPAEKQIEAVSKKLQELNPGFDGRETHAFDEAGEAIIELHFCTDKVTDISPVRALTRLQKLSCKGAFSPDAEAPGQLDSLGALDGLKLTWLDCSFNGQLADLGPLKGMPLTDLQCSQTKVSDLSPLKGMK